MIFKEAVDTSNVTQEQLRAAVQSAPKKPYIKNVIAALIDYSTLNDSQKNLIGSIDKTGKYSSEYLKSNPKILLQYKKDGTLDLYPPSTEDLKNKYRIGVQPDQKILDALQKAGIDKKIAQFAIKTSTTMMATAKDCGVEGRTIDAPASWGVGQTQTAEVGSFIVDNGNDPYVCNADGNLPIGYIAAK